MRSARGLHRESKCFQVHVSKARDLYHVKEQQFLWPVLLQAKWQCLYFSIHESHCTAGGKPPKNDAAWNEQLRDKPILQKPSDEFCAIFGNTDEKLYDKLTRHRLL